MGDKVEKLEALRGFAAAYVFAGHFFISRHLDKSSAMGVTLRFGQEAVVLFFIISGFVIYFSLEKQPQSFPIYLKRRARRIYPIYLMALVMSVALTDTIDMIGWKSTLIQAMGNIAMLQDFGAGKPGVWFSTLGGNGALWSLSYEWWFYMMFYPIHVHVPPARQLDVAGAISLSGYVTYQILPNQISLFMMYFILWWSGVEIAKLYLSGRDISYFSLRRVFVYVGAMTLLLSAPCAVAWVKHQPLEFGVHPVLELRHFMACLVFIVLGVAWRKNGWALFSSTMGPFSVVAPMSYALYVFHYPLSISATYLDNIGARWQQGLLYALITFVLAYLAEVPLQDAINRRFPIRRGVSNKSRSAQTACR